MRLRAIAISVAALIGMSTAITSFGHHSQSEFDFGNLMEVEGTVTELIWRSPHAWLHVDIVGEDGEVVNWGWELPSPTTLMRRGWTRKSLMPGDAVTVNGAPARNHDAIGYARSIKDADGNGVFTGITDVN
jgi:hypothetical protein